MTKELFRGLLNTLQNMALGITGTVYRILEIPESEGALGYTSSNKTIHVARVHPLIEGLKDAKEKSAFIMGVFAHELMHQLETDFAFFEKKLEALPDMNQKIFQSIVNVMEDPAIEYWAPSYFGGLLLKSLKFSINTCYKQMEEINPTSRPFSQFMTAAIQYGDGGFLKGDFSDPLAKKIFFEALPIMDKCILEPDGTKRILLAEEVYELTRPLWEDDVREMERMKKLMEELEKLLEEAGKPMEASGDGPCKEARSKTSPGKTSKMAKREETKEKGASGSEESESKDGEDGEAKEPGESSKGESSSSSDNGNDSDGETSSEKSKGDNKSDSKNAPDDLPTYSDRETSSENVGEFENSGDTDYSDGVIDEAEYELTDEDWKAIEEEVEKCLKSSEIEKNDTDIDIDFSSPETDQIYSMASCVNLTIKDDPALEEEYLRLVTALSGGINSLTHQLKRIFRNDVEQREYRQSGRLNIKRLQSTRMTPRVYDRRIAPQNKDDLAVMLAVDTSGSMGGSKAMLAKQAAIGLAEVFNNLKIPFKVMSFSADLTVNGRNYNAVHTHFVNWSSKLKERAKLLDISARGNNYDGYSITYAAEQLKKRKEAHKLLIVISDGQPATYAYRTTQEGVNDTKNAVKKAKKKANVIGIAIDANADVIQSFYGDKFVQIEDISDLFEQLGAVIRKEIRSW